MKLSNHFEVSSFSGLHNQIRAAFIRSAHPVHTGKWQSVDVSKRPEAAMHELLNVTATVPLGRHADLDAFRRDINPNLPWADDHFEERVSGAPMNPGTEWANWPWGTSAASALNERGMFNHNYMERLWPQFAGYVNHPTRTAEEWQAGLEGHDEYFNLVGRLGIRGVTVGDLDDLCELIQSDPLTRQAYIPLFFPEDTGIGDGGRKPCTLGYQVILREGAVHIYYPMRSCDFAHHMRDDIYMAVRLLMWIKERSGPEWAAAKLGSYSMHCTSLHVFANDFRKLHERDQ